MKNLRHLLRRSGWLSSNKRRQPRTSSSGEQRSGNRPLKSEALEKRQLLAGDIALAHNYVNGLDVDHNYSLTARDALIVVNHLAKHGSGQKITTFDESMHYVDVNGDGMVTANDALRVINGLQSGEGVGEAVELTLNARDTNDVAITPDANGEINVTVGETFNLELGFLDLRGFDAKGVAKYIADLSVSVDNVLIPAITETQQFGFDEAAFIDERTGTGTITISVEGNTDSVEIPISQFLASPTAPATQTKDALVTLGYDEAELDVKFLDFRDDPPSTVADGKADVLVRVRYIGEDNVFKNIPSIQVTVAGTSRPFDAIINEFNPLNVDGTINSDAVAFNLNAESRSLNNTEYFDRLPTGGYSETGGFDNLGGTNFVGPPNEGNFSADLSQVFDAVSIPVRVTQAVQDLVVTINPANDEPADATIEGLILYRENDPLPVDMILVDGDGSITINATGGTFVADDATLPATEDMSATLDLSTLITGATADSLAVSTNGTIGSASISGTTLTYTPNADANGTDTIVYTATAGTISDTGTITVNIAAENDPPVATDDAVNALVDTAATIQVADLIANDSTGAANEADTLTITGVGNPTTDGATATLNGSTITYTPASGFTGTDTFTYTLSDGTDTDTGTVTVTVGQIAAPVAGDSSLAVVEDIANTLDLSTLLSGGAFTTLSVTTNGSRGSASISGTTLTYTPNADDNGTDTIVYTATNAGGSDTGTIAVTIAAVNDPPVADDDSFSTDQDTDLTIQVAELLAGDSTGAANEADTLTVTAVSNGTSGTATLAGTTVTYTPNPGFSGSDTFTYTVSDGTDTDTGTVTITVNAVLAPPIAADSSLNVNENTAGTIDLSTLLSGGSVDTLAITTNGVNGTASLSGTTLTYTPDANTAGVDTIVYTATNAAGSDTGTISVTITDINNPPTSGPVSVNATEDIATTFSSATILANASPGAGEDSSQTVSISAVSSPTSQSGTATLNAGGGIDYSPAADFFGSDTFTVTITDTGAPAQSVDFVVTVNVASVNDSPNANNDSDSVLAGSTVRIAVLSNDNAGPSNEDQTLTVVSASSADGIATVESDGTISFTPQTDFIGNATIDYTIRDSDGLEDSATVTVLVQDFQPSTVSGLIFIDQVSNIDNVVPPVSAPPIRDGVMSENEEGLSGIAVRLVATGDTNAATVTVYTDIDGSYRFTNVAPGSYSVVYDLPDTVLYVGPTSSPVTIGAAGGESASGGNVGSLGLTGGLSNIDILLFSYLSANPDMSHISNGGLEGGSVSLDPEGNQMLLKIGEGYDGVDFAELTLNENLDSALLTIIEAGVVKSAELSSDHFIVSRDGSAVQFFGGLDDFEFVESLTSSVTDEFENYRNAIDKILGEF